MHLLSEKDTEARTAICSTCGPVRLSKRGPQWRCLEAHRVQRNRDKVRTKYGISWRERDAMLLAQDGRCAICSDPMPSPCVDHCHATGAVRGLLCQSCNLGLGAFLDDPFRLAAAMTYLAGD